MISLGHIDLLMFRERLQLRKDGDGHTVVTDPVRRSPVLLTPEELVRQLWLRYLLDERHVPRHRMAVERGFGTDLPFRFDLLILDASLQPFLLAEFKAPEVALGQDVFDQVAVYNTHFDIPYALVSNGRWHYCFRFDSRQRRYHFESDLPEFP